MAQSYRYDPRLNSRQKSINARLQRPDFSIQRFCLYEIRYNQLPILIQNMRLN